MVPFDIRQMRNCAAKRISLGEYSSRRDLEMEAGGNDRRDQ
jgi:hypothetical protein